MHSTLPRIHATTILAVRRDGKVALGGDGQVTVGETVMKSNAQKVRALRGGQLLAGNRSRAKVPLWAARIALLHALGARIAGVAQGVGPLPHPSDLGLTACAVRRTRAFSVRDEESVAVCEAHGMAMVATGVRHFRH